MALLEYGAHVVHVVEHDVLEERDEVQQRRVIRTAEERLDRHRVFGLRIYARGIESEKQGLPIACSEALCRHRRGIGMIDE